MARNRNEYAAKLLTSLERSDLPAWLWDGAAGRVLWSNEAGLSFWEEETLAGLLARRFDAEIPGIARMSRLADTALPETGQLQRLRFFHGWDPVDLTCLVHPDPNGGQDSVLVRVLEAPAAAENAGSARETAPAQADEAARESAGPEHIAPGRQEILPPETGGPEPQTRLRVDRPDLPVDRPDKAGALSNGERRAFDSIAAQIAEAKVEPGEDGAFFQPPETGAFPPGQGDAAPGPETGDPGPEGGNLGRILNLVSDAVLLLDAEMKIIGANDAVPDLFGLSATDLAGRGLDAVLRPASAVLAQRMLEKLEPGGAAGEAVDFTGRAVSGHRPSLIGAGARLSGQTPARYCFIVRRGLGAAQGAEGKSAATGGQGVEAASGAIAGDSDVARIGHELRTPLNSILGFTEIMREERFGPLGHEKYKDYLKDIDDAGRHLLSLVNDLLSLSRLGAGKFALNFTRVDAAETIRQCVSLMQPQAGQRRIIMRTSLSPRLPAVVADQRSLRQILINLLSNAVKYTDPGGQVILSAVEGKNGALHIRVRDTGIGMTPREIKQALKPYARINGRGKDEDSTGLGLPLAKSLTEANRASFKIDSTPGAGTLVQITFPPARIAAR